MDCDYCIIKDATINDVCLPVLLRSTNTNLDIESGWEETCNLAHKRPASWGFCRIKNKKVQCCKMCKSFV